MGPSPVKRRARPGDATCSFLSRSWPRRRSSGTQAVDSARGGVHPDDDERAPAALAHEVGVATIEIGEGARDARRRAHRRRRPSRSTRSPSGRSGAARPRDHEERAHGEGRSEPRLQGLLDRGRLGAQDARLDLEAVLHPRGLGKQDRGGETRGEPDEPSPARRGGRHQAPDASRRGSRDPLTARRAGRSGVSPCRRASAARPGSKAP